MTGLARIRQMSVRRLPYSRQTKLSLLVVLGLGSLLLCSCSQGPSGGYLGLTIMVIDSAARVTQVYEKGPAADAGISVGDEIARINGRVCAGKSGDAVARNLRGGIGGLVSLDLRRPDGSVYSVRTQRVSPLKIGGGFVATEGIVPHVTLTRVREAFDYARCVVLRSLGDPTVHASESFEAWLAKPDDGQSLFRGGAEKFLVSSWIEDDFGVLVYAISVSRSQGKWSYDCTPDGKASGKIGRGDAKGETKLADLSGGYAGLPPELRPSRYAEASAIRAQYLSSVQTLAGLREKYISSALYISETETPSAWYARLDSAIEALKAWIDANTARSVPDDLAQMHSNLDAKAHAVYDKLAAFDSQAKTVYQLVASGGYGRIEDLASDPTSSRLVLQTYETRDECEAALSQLAVALSDVQAALAAANRTP